MTSLFGHFLPKIDQMTQNSALYSNKQNVPIVTLTCLDWFWVKFFFSGSLFRSTVFIFFHIYRVHDVDILHLPPGRSLLLLHQPHPLWFHQPKFLQCLSSVLSTALGTIFNRASDKGSRRFHNHSASKRFHIKCPSLWLWNLHKSLFEAVPFGNICEFIINHPPKIAAIVPP